MPCRHSRSATGRGPGDRSGQAGSNGSISAHKSSSTIHGRILTAPRTAESSHRLRPTGASEQNPVRALAFEEPGDGRAVQPQPEHALQRRLELGQQAAYRLLVRVASAARS